MALELLAIDLGKRSFHLYGIDTDGMILSRKVSRAKLAEMVGSLAPKTIAMEACASAHYWARCWLAGGHEVRLINPRFVKPFVKGSKNDAVDAEAIFEAAMRPTMRFVPVKSIGPAGSAIAASRPRPADRPTDGADQPHARPARRIRHRAAARPVALYGPGTRSHRRCRPVRPGARRSSASCWTSSLTSSRGSRGSTRRWCAICRTNADMPAARQAARRRSGHRDSDGRCRRRRPTVSLGPGDGGLDRLVPRQYTTGGKPRLGGIGRRANHYLRRQMIHGARAVVSRLPSMNDRRSMVEGACRPAWLQPDDCRAGQQDGEDRLGAAGPRRKSMRPR